MGASQPPWLTAAVTAAGAAAAFARCARVVGFLAFSARCQGSLRRRQGEGGGHQLVVFTARVNLHRRSRHYAAAAWSKSPLVRIRTGIRIRIAPWGKHIAHGYSFSFSYTVQSIVLGFAVILASARVLSFLSSTHTCPRAGPAPVLSSQAIVY
jgi:hypothetical protein